ncbi:hypothetical protein L21SP5_00374 [Salinivirga cyanobacteriivorans]|uniref:Uncharacterized protein n=1 Tax=Salinivirga cyanobacteriivorans TaxID=1307839 RepID=A0A0S2HVN9_9BACT|nr:hypothetical protein [Salinivirga cyanobacteriivorans]ALO14053.1 hypothetical protein L21SP5_00374 [Salinivirga cyanobacteriivorans]
MKFVEGNLSYGQFRFEYFNEENSFIESQRHIANSFFAFADNYIKPYAIELCFKQFDSSTELPMAKKDYHAFLLKIENPKLSFMPIWSNTQEIYVSQINRDTVFQFVLEQNVGNIQNEPLTGMSHFSFQTGLFRLPTKIDARKFYLEKENQVHTAMEYPCISDTWFEAPLNHIFLFPPIELNFSREPYSKAWSLLIVLNWNMYSHQNEDGFKLLSHKFEVLEKLGWQIV